MQISNITDPRYLEDAPKEPEVFKCGLCDEKFDARLEKWSTKSGVMLVCEGCVKEGMDDNYTVLIEPVNEKEVSVSRS